MSNNFIEFMMNGNNALDTEIIRLKYIVIYRWISEDLIHDKCFLEASSICKLSSKYAKSILEVHILEKAFSVLVSWRNIVHGVTSSVRRHPWNCGDLYLMSSSKIPNLYLQWETNETSIEIFNSEKNNDIYSHITNITHSMYLLFNDFLFSGMNLPSPILIGKPTKLPPIGDDSGFKSIAIHSQY